MKIVDGGLQSDSSPGPFGDPLEDLGDGRPGSQVDQSANRESRYAHTRAVSREVARSFGNAARKVGSSALVGGAGEGASPRRMTVMSPSMVTDISTQDLTIAKTRNGSSLGSAVAGIRATP